MQTALSCALRARAAMLNSSTNHSLIDVVGPTAAAAVTQSMHET